MLARWTKALRVSAVVAASFAATSLIAPSPAHALEGIQGRHAIFYPSLELIYQHDDNFFLTPRDEVSADSFLAKAHFRLEIPGARQHLDMEYSPAYRDVDVSKSEYRRAYPGQPDWDLDDNISHFWKLNARLRGSSVFKVDIDQNLSIGFLETHEMDEGREYVDQASEQFMTHDITLAFKWEGSRQGAKVYIGKDDTSFDNPNDAPAWFELNGWRLGTEYHYKFAPLTSFLVGFEHEDVTEDFTLKLRQATGIPTVDSTRDTLWFGFQGEMGRTTTGRAQLGFSSLDFDSLGQNDSWDGVVVRGDVTKAFSRYTKLIFNAKREPFYSAFAPTAATQNSYYVSNNASVTLTGQPMGSKVFWTLIGQFQRNDYDTATLETDGVLRDRQDDIHRLRAEIGFHPIEHVSFRLNYQWEERDSNLRSPALDFDYEDNLVIFQVQVGF